ncbi:hypothetical protein [Paenibacillus sp. A3]|uniref:hypothetical protein n=1 Tax=Paenibacillus sp. A3 TaxID=1337054 RepID=UPI000ADD6DEE|nr:hypothetical protein [Paenibacillus sp. A3]
MINRTIKILSLIIILNFLLSACENADTKVTHNQVNENPTKSEVAMDHQKNQDQAIRNFMLQLEDNIVKVDSKGFKGMLDQHGVYSITYFEDGRDPNVVLHLYGNEIRDDLVLANSTKTGIGVSPMVASNAELENMPVHSNEWLKNLSFNVDWHINDENLIQSKLDDIIKLCEKMVLMNNEYIPQVFQLKDNIFVFTKSNVSPEPYYSFTGRWVIFEKIDNEYKLRAIMEFQ